jgi:hypothetical protein
MFSLSSAVLCLTGLVVLFLGLLTGAPLGSAINQSKSEEQVRAWRVAHSSLVNGGVMVLAIAVVLPHLGLSGGLQLFAAALLCASVSAFSFALIAGAWRGHRGLQKGEGAMANAIYAANMLGAALSLAATLLLIYGAAVALALALG